MIEVQTSVAMRNGDAVLAEIRDLLPESAVLSGAADTSRYCTDERRKYSEPALCVCRPQTTQQVSDLMAILHRHKWPMLPQGGNTSLCGGATPDTRLPVVISLERMNRIREVDEFGLTIAADAGCPLIQIQTAAAEAGMLYPVSLGAEGTCQLGGTISTNAGGTAVVRYGTTRTNTLGLEVVLPDGRILDLMRALHKDTAGYDLKQMFIGAEGTLGLITGAVMRLHPAAPARSMCWLRIDAPEKALKLLQVFRAQAGRLLTAFELMNAQQLRNVLEDGHGHSCPVDQTDGWHLLVELADTRLDGLEALMLVALETAFSEDLLLDGVIAQNLSQVEAMWKIRHSVTEANVKVGVSITSDTAVPVRAVPEFIARAEAAVMAIDPGILVTVVGHVGDGNIHFIALFPQAVWAGVEDQRALEARIRVAVNDIAIELGGTFSAEHGVGQSIVGMMERYKSGPELDLMRRIKRAVDPDALMNRGRVIGQALDDER